MIPWFQWTTIHIGFLTLQVWGLFVSLGMILALVIIARRGRVLGHTVEQLLDLALWVILSGFLFARLFHVFLYEPVYYWENPLEIIALWHGGLSSFGGIVGAVVAFWVFARKYLWDKVVLIRVVDVFSYGALFAWMVGRVGCLMIHDHMGAHSNCPFAIRTHDGPRLEMALMEILGLIPLAILFFALRKRKLADGWFAGVLFIYYGVLRFILDFWRATDIANADVRYLGLTPAQYFAILLVVFGSILSFRVCAAARRGIFRS